MNVKPLGGLNLLINLLILLIHPIYKKCKEISKL